MECGEALEEGHFSSVHNWYLCKRILPISTFYISSPFYVNSSLVKLSFDSIQACSSKTAWPCRRQNGLAWQSTKKWLDCYRRRQYHWIEDGTCICKRSAEPSARTLQTTFPLHNLPTTYRPLLSSRHHAIQPLLSAHALWLQQIYSFSNSQASKDCKARASWWLIKIIWSTSGS